MTTPVTEVAATVGQAHVRQAQFRQAGSVGEAMPPGGFEAVWQEGRETSGRPLWAVPVVLAVWAIGVPLALSLWWNDDGDAAAAGTAPPAAVCAALAGRLQAALADGDAPSAARLGHEQGYRRCLPLVDDR